MMVRTRFAPSPTGYLHIGSARSTLFNALFSAKFDGVFVLRIEDTDVTRSEVAFAESQQNDLKWLGIEWQEGPGVDGPYGPYWQSKRQAIYDEFYEILEKNQQIYPCFCTDQELLLARKLQLSRGHAPKYSGTCKRLSKEEIAERIAAGEAPAWRFAVPQNETVEFVDLIKGQQKFNTDDIGDFIVRRKDGTPPFLFCNAVDDAKMKISHVIRGEDHLSNTIRQVLIFQTLKLPIPHYAHLSLIVGDDGAPLSKRHGSYSLSEMREQGYLPEAIDNYLARLGVPCESQEVLTINELAKYFNLEKVSRSPARFDKSQLMYWQKMAIQKMGTTELWHWFGEKVLVNVPEASQNLFIESIKANVEFPHDALAWARIFFDETVYIEDANLSILYEAGDAFFVESDKAFREHSDLHHVLAALKKNLGVNGKQLFMPLRVALTGKPHGPELINIVNLLGKEKVLNRLQHALRLVKEQPKE